MERKPHDLRGQDDVIGSLVNLLIAHVRAKVPAIQQFGFFIFFRSALEYWLCLRTVVKPQASQGSAELFGAWDRLDLGACLQTRIFVRTRLNHA